MTPLDDDRGSRSQVSLRLDRDVLDSVDELAEAEGVDRTELVRRLLADGLAHRRMQLAIDDYAAGRRSAWSAAALAGVDLYQMLDRIAEAGVPYAIDPDALVRLAASDRDPPPDGHVREPASSALPEREPDTIELLRAEYRPSRIRLLFVGESSPAGGTHFYLANSNLFRAIREALGVGLAVSSPPDGDAFLAWFRDLGCWLTDVADEPVNRLPDAERSRVVDAGVNALADRMRRDRPDRTVVVLRRIAPAVRAAARMADLDDRTIDVLPFPVRQWRSVFVQQLAGIVGDVLGAGPPGPAEASDATRAAATRHAVAEDPAAYGQPPLHEVIAEILGARGNDWMTPTAIAREIAAAHLWSRPGDGQPPPASQVSARARRYPDLFQVSDLGIRRREL